jgi:hypothetical protein
MYISSPELSGKVTQLPNGDYVADASDIGLKPAQFPREIIIGSDGAFRFEHYLFNKDNDIKEAQYRNCDDRKFFIIND